MSKQQIYVALNFVGLVDRDDKGWFMCDKISIGSSNPDAKRLIIEENGQEFDLYVKPSTFVYIVPRDNDWERSAKELLKDFPTYVWEEEKEN